MFLMNTLEGYPGIEHFVIFVYLWMPVLYGKSDDLFFSQRFQKTVLETYNIEGTGNNTFANLAVPWKEGQIAFEGIDRSDAIFDL